ncbi:MAG: hypothetical protein U9Q03_01715 [Patescibacteria group bacterium]|nr:hypothetical protein [Patescibacteria group bacterium]
MDTTTKFVLALVGLVAVGLIDLSMAPAAGVGSASAVEFGEIPAIGALLPIDGGDAERGASMKRGLLMARRERIPSGPDIIIADSRCDTGYATTQAELLVEQGVGTLVVGICEEAVEAAKAVVEGRGVPLIAAGLTETTGRGADSIVCAMSGENFAERFEREFGTAPDADACMGYSAYITALGTGRHVGAQ